MKRLTLTVFSFLLAAMLSLPVLAQHNGHHEDDQAPRDLMQMMHRMMEDPEHRSMMVPCLATEIGDELGLSSVQHERLSAVQSEIWDAETMCDAMMGAAAQVRDILSDEQHQRLQGLDMATLHQAMTARMRSGDGHMMDCPVMERVMDGQMMNEPESPSHDHQH